MKTPSVLLLAGTLLVAGSAALLVRVMLKPAPAPAPVVVAPPPAPPALPAVLVAARDLHPGEFIDANAVRWQQLEGEHSSLLFFIDNKDSLAVAVGGTVRRPLREGQPLAATMLIKPGEPGFIAAVLQPGLRAISVPTSAVASNSGMVSTGDRVDVVLSLDRDKEKESAGAGSGVPRLASQTLLRNVRVLALNNITRGALTVREEQPAEKDKKRYTSFETVTLEVTPAQAERLSVAKEVGTLQLVLRGAREPRQPMVTDGRSITTLSQATGLYNGMSAPQAKLQMFRGDAVEERDLSR
ncbi:Flp pilus assembly protein CpaB [Pseudomonas xanthosomatis]|uniref:Flp pilus assembly protein CpaB n=1 Tax=Pseudomonas xanthosomatis TaxID=2842356 RepID=UPI001C3D6AF4|nr:Flp pilus assembly protein CpaB [Pseudomonas xanthosomatis]QXH48801.1 Flp pilus assembly protein CpaB [Pseudomonas xanthosomatis]